MPVTMRLNDYEKEVRREIEAWQRGRASALQQAFDWVMHPVDQVVRRAVPQTAIDTGTDAIEQFLSMLSDASTWTFDASEVLRDAQERGIEIERAEDLREEPLARLDPLARKHMSENAILAAIEGGGTGLGGAFLIAADIPLLFTINLRLIQQISAAYGFPMRGPAYRPLVIAIFNVAASGGQEAKHEALREISVAASSFAGGRDYKGRVSGTFHEQNRHIPRELAKNIVGRKLAQMIPVAGAAVGAGINYWFTTETAEATYMLVRALYLEHKERL